MATKADLRKSSGISAVYNGEELIFSDLECARTRDLTVDAIRSQLLNNELTCPDIFYTKYVKVDDDGVYEQKNLRLNIFLIKPNLAGIEYVKTKATKVAKYPRLLEVAYGGGIILMQKFKNKFDSDIIIVPTKKSMKIVVPPDYAVAMINTRQNAAFIVTEIQNIKARTQSVLADMRGMAYYVIRKNAKQEIVRNPLYRSASKPRKIDWDAILKENNITLKTPLIKQVLRKYEKFKWIFKENSFTLDSE